MSTSSDATFWRWTRHLIGWSALAGFLICGAVSVGFSAAYGAAPVIGFLAVGVPCAVTVAVFLLVPFPGDSGGER